MKKWLSAACILLLCGTAGFVEARKTSGKAREKISHHFEDKWVTAKVNLPNSRDGLTIVDGVVDEEGLEKEITGHGLAAEPGDELRITKFKVKDKHIEIRFDRDTKINIRFSRPITDADLDIDKINQWLEPVLSISGTKKETLSDKLQLN